MCIRDRLLAELRRWEGLIVLVGRSRLPGSLDSPTGRTLDPPVGTLVRIMRYRQSSAGGLNFSAIALVNDDPPGVCRLGPRRAMDEAEKLLK